MRRWLAWGFVASPAVACGIDESGLLVPDASMPAQDGSPDAPSMHDAQADTYVPPVCMTLDASCLNVTLPSGWEPFAMQIDAGSVTCPGDGGDFTEVAYQANPAIIGNSCVCTACGVGNGWDCEATLTGGVASCATSSQNVDASSYCWVTTGAFAGGSVTRGGTATCTPSTYYSTSATATPVAGCAPTTCTADFCGLASRGFKLCARNGSQSDGGCPPGLPVSYLVGANPHAACNPCPTCTITNDASAACSATITGYTGTDCMTGMIGGATLNGTCMGPSPMPYGSIAYKATVPTPTCSPTGPTNVGGTPELDSPLTVCCTN